MSFTKKYLVDYLAGVNRSIRIAKKAQEEFEHESDWLRSNNQDLVIARLEGKRELLEELLR